MAACCIGGVCIPYSAILPLLALALKWLAAQLAAMGLLPDSVVQRFGLQKTASSSVDNYDCCSQPSTATKGSASVRTVESVEEWEELLGQQGVVVVKFTATWCKPCKEIAPHFEKLSAEYPQAVFVQVDVDDLDEVAAELNVAMMPTFVVLKGKNQLATSRGANRCNLEQLVAQHVPPRRD